MAFLYSDYLIEPRALYREKHDRWQPHLKITSARDPGQAPRTADMGLLSFIFNEESEAIQFAAQIGRGLIDSGRVKA